MTESEIYNLIESSGLPTFRGHAPTGTPVPYAVLNIEHTNNFGADDRTYLKVPGVTVEVYNTEADEAVAGAVEGVLDEAGIYWTSDSADSPDESLFIYYYYFGGLTNG